eukprot:TRINITY_DN10448_c0_g1_i1.p1 TRINITY_DN10448_c0_g1~~TRINITY_DN10448_c0_g1_i1.p1  ORF type:complete len:629 (+),score=54.27 TRINITY_DN10448_c0_g1_i1:123-1889(+)
MDEREDVCSNTVALLTSTHWPTEWCVLWHIACGSCKEVGYCSRALDCGAPEFETVAMLIITYTTLAEDAVAFSRFAEARRYFEDAAKIASTEAIRYRARASECYFRELFANKQYEAALRYEASVKDNDAADVVVLYRTKALFELNRCKDATRLVRVLKSRGVYQSVADAIETWCDLSDELHSVVEVAQLPCERINHAVKSFPVADIALDLKGRSALFESFCRCSPQPREAELCAVCLRYFPDSDVCASHAVRSHLQHANWEAAKVVLANRKSPLTGLRGKRLTEIVSKSHQWATSPGGLPSMIADMEAHLAITRPSGMFVRFTGSTDIPSWVADHLTVDSTRFVLLSLYCQALYHSKNEPDAALIADQLLALQKKATRAASSSLAFFDASSLKHISAYVAGQGCTDWQRLAKILQASDPHLDVLHEKILNCHVESKHHQEVIAYRHHIKPTHAHYCVLVMFVLDAYEALHQFQEALAYLEIVQNSDACGLWTTAKLMYRERSLRKQLPSLRDGASQQKQHSSACVSPVTWTYALLRVSSTCSCGDLKKAYRRLARDHHPDKTTDVCAETNFRNLANYVEHLGKLKGCD